MPVEITKTKDMSSVIKQRLIDATKTELLIGTTNQRAEMIAAEYGLPESNKPATPFVKEVLNKPVATLITGTADIIAGMKTSKDVLTEYAELVIAEDTPIPLEYII